jgi:hypothetical protein
MRSISRKFRTWIRQLWKPKADWDWLEMSYQILDTADRVEEERLDVLLKQRAELKRKKKKHKYLDREIELLRAKIMGRTA